MPPDYTPFSLLTDVGWISLLLVIGNLARRFIPVFQTLMIPAPMTAGLLGLALGPYGAGVIGFSDQLSTYAGILIAIVFGALPYGMEFGGHLAKGARTMWSYSVGMYMGQWGLLILFGVLLLGPLFGTPDWFGMMLPVGFVGGFGVAAAVGASLTDAGAEAAMTLGFTSAAVGTIVAIIGGLALSKWGSVTGRTSQLPEFRKLPEDLRTGLISLPGQRPSVGRATTNPSSIEPIALHGAVIILTVFAAHVITGAVAEAVPWLDIPLFAAAFVLGLAAVGVLHLVKAPHYVDKELSSSISGAATDFLVAFGVASIVPSVVAEYITPLLILFAAGLAYCLIVFFALSPAMFRRDWLERGIFGWGWATASVAMGIALLKIVDPKLKSGTMEEFGIAYVGFAPFEIAMAILAPIVVLAGVTAWFGAGATLAAVVIIGMAFVFKWVGGTATAPEAAAARE